MIAQRSIFDRPTINTASLCDPEEKVVAALLNQRVGAAMAMQVNDVARAAGVTARKAQSIVRHLIVDHGAPIGTSMREPYGWYLARTDAEMQGVIDLHRTRALSELETMAKLHKTSVRAVLARIQTELEMEAA